MESFLRQIQPTGWLIETICSVTFSLRESYVNKANERWKQREMETENIKCSNAAINIINPAATQKPHFISKAREMELISSH